MLTRLRILVLFSAATAMAATVPGPAAARPGDPELPALVRLEDVKRHLTALHDIAERNGGNRAVGQSGFDASVDYVADQLRKAGYDPQIQDFEYNLFRQKGRPALEQTAPQRQEFTHVREYLTMVYSGKGDVTAKVTPVDIGRKPSGQGSGCEAGDFSGFAAGTIALVRRGGCRFAVKARNAQQAGAAAVVVYQSDEMKAKGPIAGTLDAPAGIPVMGVDHKVGRRLAEQARKGALKLRVKADVTNERRASKNVVADARYGDEDHAVVVGAHLDSVAKGPGINDNGSGVGAILAIAEKLRELDDAGLRNRVRFAFWGAEEDGLFGSDHYVRDLGKDGLSKIAVYLNFDMLGSPNHVRLVYDGDAKAKGGRLTAPPGSEEIEKVFFDYFRARGLAAFPAPFSGSSDYAPFIKFGVPAGGLFSGADGKMTAEEAKGSGGKAGKPYDPCYHQRCDGLKNISWKGLDQMTDAAAHATQYFAAENFKPRS